MIGKFRILHDYFERFDETPETVKQACEKIRLIKKAVQSGAYSWNWKDPEYRVKEYAKYLQENFKYARWSERTFNEARFWRDEFDPRQFMNMSKFFLKGKGCCQQYAIALAMLCYDDPDIECYQMPVNLTHDASGVGKIDWFKHSMNLIRIGGKEYTMDQMTSSIFVTDSYSQKREATRLHSLSHAVNRRISKDKTVKHPFGVAYYPKGLELESIFMYMQGAGMGIKFDYDALMNREKPFMECYQQSRLAKVTKDQIQLDVDFKAQKKALETALAGDIPEPVKVHGVDTEWSRDGDQVIPQAIVPCSQEETTKGPRLP